jgi:hypothetical protein
MICLLLARHDTHICRGEGRLPHPLTLQSSKQEWPVALATVGYRLGDWGCNLGNAWIPPPPGLPPTQLERR